MNNYLNEAFKQLEMLNEEEYVPNELKKPKSEA